MANAGPLGTSNSFWCDLWSYFGPALIVSVAYIDSGNDGTDISGAARSVIACFGLSGSRE